MDPIVGDTVSYILAPIGVILSLSKNSLSAAQGWAEGDTYVNTHSAIGSNFNDIIYGANDSADSQLQGEGGADILYGGTESAGFTLFIGDDTGANNGPVGADTFYLGAGRNPFDYETASDAVSVYLERPGDNLGDAQGDTYDSSNGAMTVAWDAANPTLAVAVYGSEYADHIEGDAGNNILLGDPFLSSRYLNDGPDELYGRAGTTSSTVRETMTCSLKATARTISSAATDLTPLDIFS